MEISILNHWLTWSLLVVSLLLSGFFIARYIKQRIQYGKNPIKVGILHSLTGTMAISERPVVNGTMMAIREINNKGGLLGRKIKPILLDGRSDSRVFAKNAETMIVDEKVSVVFGCWTSESRKTMKPIFEKHNHLLIYPLQYEGLEESSVIVYVGSTPNQQMMPTVAWASNHIGKRFYLVGSDYIYPHALNEVIKEQIKNMGDTIVGESYIPFGSKNVNKVIEDIIEAKPDVIINNINGDTNIAFFKTLREKGISSKDIPTISFSIAENELLSLKIDDVEGDYAAWSYFQSIPSEINSIFVTNYKKMYGQDQVTSDPIECAYTGVYLWAGAVRDAKTDNVNQVRKTMKGQKFQAPQGLISIDTNTHHTWKELRIGQINKQGQFDIVWSSNKVLRPIVYPVYRSKAEWDNYLYKLYKSWGDSWSNPNTNN